MISKENLTHMFARQYRQFLEIKKRVVLNDFYEFSKEVLGWKDLHEPLHKPICDVMQNPKYRKKLLLIPRGHLKSTVVTVGYSLWKIARNPKIRILIANATYEMAVTFLSQIKSHLEKNEKFIELFGNMVSKADKWSENQITVKRPEDYYMKEPTITAFGIGGNLVSQHYDLIIGDDLVNRDNIHTPDRIEGVKIFYKDLQDLVDNPMTSEIVLIGTRWHEGDLYGTILDTDNPERHEYKVYQRTAIEGEYAILKDKASGRYIIDGGETIFPGKFTRSGLESLINSKGLSEFSAQYLNDPVPSTDATFKHEFKYYEPEDLRGQQMFTYITLDPAFFDPRSRIADLDYTVFMVVDVNINNDWFIRDIIRSRMQPNEIINMIFDLDSQYHPRTFGIESVAYQKILGYMAQEQMRKRNQFPPIQELKHAGANARSKAERIQALEPRYAVGSIYHNKYVRNISILEMELRRFPRGRTDDCADALASMLEIAEPPKAYTHRERGSVARFLNYPG